MFNDVAVPLLYGHDWCVILRHMRRVDHVNYKGQWAPFGSIIKADSIRTTVAQIRRMSLLFVYNCCTK